MDASTTRSRSIVHRLHAFTNLDRHESEGPPAIASGKGIGACDDAEPEYLDGRAGLWCAAQGLGEERPVEAAAVRQMRRPPDDHRLGRGADHVAIALDETAAPPGRR